MSSYIIRNAHIVNDGKIVVGDVYFKNGFINRVDNSIGNVKEKYEEVNAEGLYLFPGCIDDQVHFREPGLTHKAEIYTEAKAAVAGGITSYMEMPNTVPNTLTQKLLEEKYKRASEVSLANYSFFMGTSNDNADEVLRTDPNTVCGIKIFMGSSTGNMLVDHADALERIFANAQTLIATHCEDENTIKQNLAAAKEKFGEDIPVEMHPVIRSAEACYKSSSMAVALAKKHNTRLHVLHISTAIETALFDNSIPLKEKRITAEACVHHLWFSDADYATKGNLIKWNPAIKTADDRDAVLKALLENKIDIIATDHAPHTLEEKNQLYSKAPGGGPLVQHALVAMLELYHQKKISLEKIAEKMCHAPADCFQLNRRGFLFEDYAADAVLVNLNSAWKVEKSNLLYKCGWSPFENTVFQSKVIHTFVNGNHVYNNGIFNENKNGERLMFNRK